MFLANRKTSVRLPPVMWDALNDIANHLKLPRDNLLQQIDRDREPEQGLTEAIRVYILEFYRARVKL